ncbi:hypothetical protein NEOLEDRAFT_1118487 [Neolentinus lepideus HHB14362 ss-1]|uniref:Uncharacterized protein n=1 Tax=Neolentinus lepideus HHB14362 ss-1 TaxID=1314782 RepID=A0A165QWH8_9AGAM|nr:hypothetical protein NEOLEDRAFT_1118487 [Neolentinus lepideus HHB14362 ss-1]
MDSVISKTFVDTSVSLKAAGFIALANLQGIAHRTAFIGSSSFLDILFLAPGIHCQQEASDVNHGEYPTTGAMTTGYVFRVENQATVNFLQRVGKTGHLVTVWVHPPSPHLESFSTDTVAHTLYIVGIAQTITVVAALAHFRDFWALGVLAMLITARLCNVAVIKRRGVMGWKGAPEPGVNGDLFITLSQDRWVRMRGLVDDIKAVTSGQWLREESTVESFFVTTGTLLVYASAAVALNASTFGNSLIAYLLLSSLALLGLCNALTKTQRMFGRSIQVDGEPRHFTRRLELVNELIKVHNRQDWAITMGLIVPKEDKLRPVII